MIVIPLSATPSQKVTVNLNNQLCLIDVYQKFYGLFLDLYVNDALIIGGVICQNHNRIVRDLYFGFVGDLGFINTQDTTDPYYTGLGDKYNLVYLEPGIDLAVGEG